MEQIISSLSPIESLKLIYRTKCNAKGSDIAGHLPLLYELTSILKPEIIIQAGIRDGNSDSAFALAALENNLHLIDIDINDVQDYELRQIRLVYPKWEFHQGRTDDRTINNNLQRYIGSVGIFFTDTSHNYEDTKFELDNYSKLLSPQGIILIHDMDPWNHFPDQARAVNEFLSENPEWKVQLQKGNNGMAVLYRNEEDLGGVVCNNILPIGTHT